MTWAFFSPISTPNDKNIEFVCKKLFSALITFQDECRRLRQSIKCGLVNRLTVVSMHNYMLSSVACLGLNICGS